MTNDMISKKKETKYFQIGNFIFQAIIPKTITPPANFLLFEIPEEKSAAYSYRIELTDSLEPDKNFGLLKKDPVARREDLLVFRSDNLETRLLKVKGSPGYYALYQELSDTEAIIYLNNCFTNLFSLDTVFTSLFALERRLLPRDGLVLHCACLQYDKEAILFTAPSGIGKSTQASLWEKYKNGKIINGDRILLLHQHNTWNAHGWPVCGSSEICHNTSLSIRAIILLSQEQKNTLSKVTNMEAFTGLYSQITVNGWDSLSAGHVMDLIEQLIRSIPVYHLGCTISKEAVELLAEELYC